jgi:NADPH:quinone reductase-like Zn-dependent oxidoreductase
MKAVRFHRHGGPEVLQYEEAPDPEPDSDEALVRVKACALNHLDIWARNGLPNVAIQMPHISGSDIAGVVERIPQEEKGFRKGDEVIVNPGVGCGRCEKCLSGRDNQCSAYKIIGYGTDGGYAEFARVRRTHLVRKPAGLTFEEAASFPLVYETAYHMLVTKAGVGPGDTVLILAANSGVAIAAIQIAKLLGAKVIATAGDSDKAEGARRLGADFTINHYKQSVLSEAKRLTGNRGVDVVVEHVGEATWEGSIKALAKGGRLVTCGATTGADARTDLRYVFSRELTIYGSYMAGLGELLEVTKLFEQGRLKTVVDSIFPLKRAGDAQTKMERSRHFGKIVLRI